MSLPAISGVLVAAESPDVMALTGLVVGPVSGLMSVIEGQDSAALAGVVVGNTFASIAAIEAQDMMAMTAVYTSTVLRSVRDVAICRSRSASDDAAGLCRNATAQATFGRNRLH